MEYAKKYVLVDPNFTRPSLTDKTLSTLDKDIEQILNSNLSDDVKAQNYMASLRRYRQYSLPPQSSPSTSLEREEKGDITSKLDKLEPDVLTSMHPDIQHKAKRLIKQLKKQSSLDFNSDGEIVYNKHVIPNSNIIDLVDDVLSKGNRDKSPIGWREFSSGLKESNVPSELISNPIRWKYISGDNSKKRSVVKRRRWQYDE